MQLRGRLESTPLLDVIQMISYSQQTGLLRVAGPGFLGLVIFERGDVACAHAPSALPLLVKAAKESDPTARLALRRIQALMVLRELLDADQGSYRFDQTDKPITDIEGLDIGSFYDEESLDTGDLLLVLERAAASAPVRI